MLLLEENDAEEVFQTSASGVSVDDSQCVTPISGRYWGTVQCRPIDLYKKATKDYKLSQVKPVRQKIGGSELRVVGRVLLRVRRGDFKCRLDCKLVGQQGIRPLLGRKACIGMKIVAYLNNDQLNKPSTKDAEVYAVGDDESSQVTKEQLIQKYPSVFTNEVGLLEDLDPQADPIQHAPQRVPVARREGLRETLDDLVKREVLAPVTRPTPWVSSMVAVDKPDGRMRICLDPKELNEAIQREHPSRKLQLASMEPNCSQFWMLEMDSGISCWMKHYLSLPHSTLLSVDIIGSVCPLASVQLRKCFNAGCVKWWKASREWK